MSSLFEGISTFFETNWPALVAAAALPVTLVFAKMANVDILLREIIRNHENLHRKLSLLWNLLMKIY